MTVPALAITGVTKRYGPVIAVNDLHLRIEPGEVVAFLGPNGAGKSTSIDMILGLIHPDSGTIEVNGRTPAQAVACGGVAAVMQSGGLLRDFTVAETVTYIASLYRQPRPVADVLADAGLTGLADRAVGRCSGGEQQRLRFALALLARPRLLVLDEPTTGMDVAGRRDFWAAVRAYPEKPTVLFATHYLDEADTYADRVVLIHRGSIVADGPAATVRNLVGGRLVRVVWPGADLPPVRALPGVRSVEARGDNVFIRCDDSDSVVRHLLNHTGAYDVEVTGRNLEAAFLALTDDGTDRDDLLEANR